MFKNPNNVEPGDFCTIYFGMPPNTATVSGVLECIDYSRQQIIMLYLSGSNGRRYTFAFSLVSAIV